MKVSFKREILFQGTTSIYRFDWPIKEIITFDEKGAIVVMLDRECYRKDSRNIFCISEKGEMLWQIPDVPLVLNIDGKSPYTRIEKDGYFVKAFNWDGTILKLDPLTGKVLNNHWTK